MKAATESRCSKEQKTSSHFTCRLSFSVSVRKFLYFGFFMKVHQYGLRTGSCTFIPETEYYRSFGCTPVIVTDKFALQSK